MKKFLLLSCGMVLLCTASLESQQPARVINVPFERGLYYDAPSGLVTVPATVFLPFQTGGFREFMGLGSRGVVAELPGPHAAIMLNNLRPAFYLRGYRAGSRLYLVRAVEKDDYREVRASRDRHFTGWERFHAKDLADIEVEQTADNLAVVRPRTDLKPGEYVLIGVLEPRYRSIRLAYEFGITRAAGSSGD